MMAKSSLSHYKQMPGREVGSEPRTLLVGYGLHTLRDLTLLPPLVASYQSKIGIKPEYLLKSFVSMSPSSS